MKNRISLIYICITISIINLFAILFYWQQKTIPATNFPSATATGDISSVTSDVALPESISLAGEKVPLERLDVQEALKKELIVNTYLHSHTIQLLKNSPRIFGIIEPILKEAGVPDDFKYLAVIESNLNPLAVSPAGAVGVWQFMEGTAKDFNLEVNAEVDERYHIEKSTWAAANYLKNAYQRFGSWTIAAATYNAGMKMVANQMEMQKEKDYYNLLLGEETGRYVFRILAIKQILNNPELYHFSVNTIYPVEETKKIKINGSVKDWADFANAREISYKTLKRFNPWLRKNNLNNPKRKVYEITIPEETKNYR